MASVNKVILLGRVGQDPQLKYTQGGQAVANFSVATSEKWKSKDGTQQEKTEWHKIVAWGKTAELCAEYVSKGDLIYIEGSLETREWEKDNQKRQTTEVKARTVQFLGGSKEKPKEEPTPPLPDDGSEVPF